MTATASSPATWPNNVFVTEERAASPRTFGLTVAIPRTGEECDRLLVQARIRMRMPEMRAPFAKELARFLGAGSTVWTMDRRHSLHVLLESAGEDAVEPVLASVARTPRAEVVDDAELVLAGFARQSSTNVRVLVQRLGSADSAPVRAALLRSLAAVGDPSATPSIERALDDDSAEVRDAAATAVSLLGGTNARSALSRRLGRERNPVVLASLKDALEQLEDA